MPKPKKNESKQDYLKRCTKQVIDEGKDSKVAYAICNSFWDNEKKQRSSLVLSAPVNFSELAEGDDKTPREFLITAYTGKPIKTLFSEFIVDINGIQVKEKIPVLREHARDRVVGHGEFWKKDKNLYVSGTFSEATQDAKEVVALADEDYPWQASISVRPEKIKILRDEKETEIVNGIEVKGPMEILQKSRVGEVSFVSLGADDDTAAITMSDEKYPVDIEWHDSSIWAGTISPDGSSSTITIDLDDNENQKKEENLMEITMELLTEKAPDLLKEIQDEAHKRGVHEGIHEERSRVMEILNAEAEFKVSKECIENGTEASESFKMFFEAEKQKTADALENLENQASESVGQIPPKDPEKETDEPVDVIVARKAKELMEKEGITIDEANKRVFAENPELLKKYEATYTVD